jgi:hypothetical protein
MPNVSDADATPAEGRPCPQGRASPAAPTTRAVKGDAPADGVPRSRGSLPPPLLEANPRGEWQWYDPHHERSLNPSEICVLARYYGHSVDSTLWDNAEATGLITDEELVAILRIDWGLGTDADASLILALADRLGVPHSDTELPPQEVA